MMKNKKISPKTAKLAYIRLCQAILRDIEAENLKRKVTKFYKNLKEG